MRASDQTGPGGDRGQRLLRALLVAGLLGLGLYILSGFLRALVWALVLASFPDGGRRLYYPDPDSSPDQDAQDGRLAPGRHVLPTGRVSATDEQRSLGVVTFTPGFVLPLRADGAVVFVAVSGAAWTDTTLRQLRELADGTGSEQDTRQRLQQILPQASIAELRVRTE